MRLRVPELLEARGITAYQLAKQSDGRISLSAAYRLARGEWKCLPEVVLDALCDVLDCTPGDLLLRDSASAPRARRRR